LIILITILTIAFSVGGVAAQSNVGSLRVDRFICPRQVAPGSNFQVTVDVEYGLFGANPSAVIRSAIYNGPINSTNPIWQSDAMNVSYVGEQLWNTTLTAPSSEGYLNLTAYAFYQEDGIWKFYSNATNGPSFAEASIKVGKISNLDVYIGAPDVSVSINGASLTTSTSGDVNVNVPLNSVASISIPSNIDFQNSTRGVFSNWNDANTEPQRDITIAGDTKLAANYTLRYLLKVNAPSGYETWYNKGTVVTLTANTSTPMNWPLNAFGIQGQFTGWSGDAQSSTSQVNVTMDGPKTLNANYAFDYKLLAVPLVLGAGIIVLALSIVIFLRQRRAPPSTVSETVAETPVEKQPTCPSCGNTIEKEWTHCIKCGAKLTGETSGTT
jgi:hypothetical protein